MFLAAGDDRTDADLYRALPAGAIALHVNGVHPCAHLADQPDRAPAAAAG
jgi:hypothetical protein